MVKGAAGEVKGMTSRALRTTWRLLIPHFCNAQVALLSRLCPMRRVLSKAWTYIVKTDVSISLPLAFRL